MRFSVFLQLLRIAKKVEAESQPARILVPGLAGRQKNAIFGQFFMGSGPDLVEHRTL